MKMCYNPIYYFNVCDIMAGDIKEIKNRLIKQYKIYWESPSTKVNKKSKNSKHKILKKWEKNLLWRGHKLFLIILVFCLKYKSPVKTKTVYVKKALSG